MGELLWCVVCCVVVMMFDFREVEIKDIVHYFVKCEISITVNFNMSTIIHRSLKLGCVSD